MLNNNFEIGGFNHEPSLVTFEGDKTGFLQVTFVDVTNVGVDGQEGDFTLAEYLSSVPDESRLLATFDPENIDVCAECESELVYPIQQEKRPSNKWRLECRCPNCEVRVVTLVDQRDAEFLDNELNRAKASIETDLGYIVKNELMTDDFDIL